MPLCTPTASVVTRAADLLAAAGIPVTILRGSGGGDDDAGQERRSDDPATMPPGDAGPARHGGAPAPSS